MTNPENPFETPIPKGMRLVQGTLRVLVAIQCWGMAAGRLHLGRTTSLSEFLAPSYGWGPDQSALFENYAAYALIACGVFTLLRPCWLVLMPVICWQAGIAISSTLLGETFLVKLEPAEQAVRYICPLSLLLIDFWPPKVRPTLAFCLSAIGMLRLAAVATFAAHGIAALYQFHNPGAGNFVELLTLSLQKVFHYEITPMNAQRALAVIGALDVAVALSLLSSRSRGIALWMATWGFLTAFSRTLAYGAEGYDLTLIRIANGGAPLTVLIFWLNAVQEQKPIILPEEE